MKSVIPWVKFDEIELNHGKFIISPLDRGMGVTVGNSLRRILLSSIGGYAVTSVRIEGVTHEFSTVPGVLEDVMDIVSNLKQLIFKADGYEDKILRIEKTGKGIVTGADIVLDNTVSLVNEGQYLAEVTEQKGRLNVEITLSSGIGYDDSDVRKSVESDINQIDIDAYFSPIVKVNHQVDNIRVGNELNHDKLTLEIWTNGSVGPEEVLRKASSLMVEKLSIFNTINEKPEELESESETSDLESTRGKAMGMSIDDLELSARSSNCLKRAGIQTLGDLVQKDISELIQIKNFGKKSADEINGKLKQFGLELKLEEG